MFQTPAPSGASARTRKTGDIRPLLHFLKEAKVPWFSYLVFFALNLFATERAVRLAVITGQFMDPTLAEEGIHNSKMVLEFVLSSLLIVCIGFSTIPMSWIAVRFRARAQNRAWRALLRLPMTRFDRLDPSGLVSRVTTDAGFVPGILTSVMNLFNQAYALVLVCITLVHTDEWIALRIIPGIFLSVLVTFVASRFTYRIHFRLQEAESTLTAFLNERFSSLRFIKASQSEARETEEARRQNQKKYEAQMGLVGYNTLYTGYQSLITMLLLIFVIVTGALRIRSGSLALGSLATIYFLVQGFPGKVQSFFTNILSIIGIQGQTEVISSLVAAEEEPCSAEEDPREALANHNLAFKNLRFSYDETEPAILEKISCLIPAGKWTAVVGPSGAGKTTLLKLLERFYEGKEGELCLGDQPAARFHLSSWRRNCGFVLQNSPLLPGTIRENILYHDAAPNKETAAGERLHPRLDEVLEICQLRDMTEALPRGLDSEVGELADKISGGQRQRIALARALFHDPSLLLMDEATANMDRETEKKVSLALRRDRQNKTTVVVAHRLSTVRDADQILLLDKGKIAAAGTHEELYEKSSLYKNLVDLQDWKN